MTCQRCHDNPACYVVSSDVTLGGVRVESELQVCFPCALAAVSLPNHTLMKLSPEETDND